MIRPDPYAQISGLTVGGTAAGGDLVFVDAYSITWGRAGVLEQPTPATASLRVLDRSAGAVLARRTDLIGTEVRLGFYAAAGDTYAPQTSFRGRITDVTVERRRAGGFFVSLAASSREVEAANYVAPEGTSWPAEVFADRRARIVGLLPAGLFRPSATGGPVLTPSRADWGLLDVPDPTQDFDTYVTGPATPGGTDALTLLRELYASMSPLPMVYNPTGNYLTFPPRRVFPYIQASGNTRTAELTAPTGRGGLYVSSAFGGWDLDAHDVGDAALDQPLESRLTRVEVSYFDVTTAYASATATAGTADSGAETTIGRRTLAVSSIHGRTAYAQQLAAMYAALAGDEARSPRLGPLAFDTAVTGGFSSTGQLTALLTAVEGGAAFFLGRSWLPDLGLRPLVGIVGGSISFRAGEWSLLLNPVPVSVAQPPTPLRIREAPALRLSDLHPSVTFGDAHYLDANASLLIGG